MTLPSFSTSLIGSCDLSCTTFRPLSQTFHVIRPTKPCASPTAYHGRNQVPDRHGVARWSALQRKCFTLFLVLLRPNLISLQIRIAEELENDIPKENPTLGSLPLEFKNEIFSNLLLSTKVKYDCLAVGPRLKKYAFHTAIFRANKQLGAEATSYLYTHNNFAVVTHKYAGFENILADGCVPTIAPSLTMPFLHPAIFVNLKLTQTCTCGKNDCADPSEVAPRKKLLMLVDDLPMVISMLQIWYHVFCGSNTFILSDPEEEKITSASHCDETRAELRLCLKDNPLVHLTRKEREVRQRKLVTPFTVIQNACQTVYVTGDVFPQVAKDVSQAMMPKIVWLNAVGWDLYDVVTHHKRRLDGILDDACMHWLGNIYEHIGLVACNNNALFACQIGEDTPLAIRSLPCDAVEVSKSWQFGVLVTGVDCLLVAAGLAMKCGYHPMVYNLATSYSAQLNRMSTFRKLSPILSKHSHTITWVSVRSE